MWYVLRCRSGQEKTIIHFCRHHLSCDVLDEVFSFRCERFWRSKGIWKLVEREMFPGYVFLASQKPGMLLKELELYRKSQIILKEPGCLMSVYEEEEQWLKRLCGIHHFFKISYGYRDRKSRQDCITEGPLKEMSAQIQKIDWHRRFAQVEIPIARRKTVVWAGIGLDERRTEGIKKEIGQNILVS